MLLLVFFCHNFSGFTNISPLLGLAVRANTKIIPIRAVVVLKSGPAFLNCHRQRWRRGIAMATCDDFISIFNQFSQNVSKLISIAPNVIEQQVEFFD